MRGVLAVLSCALVCPSLAPAEDQASSVVESIGKEVHAIFDKCQKAVVKIEGVDTHGHLSGTGFFIDPNGTLYTSYTIGGESRELVVSHGQMKYPARRLIGDPRSGVAILKVDVDTPFLMIGKSRELALASPVLAIGYPMDLPLTPSFGTIGGFDLKYLGRYFATTHLRANLPVQRGEGGAPLLNMRGEAVGIIIASLDQGSASFVLPIEAAEKVRRDFVRFGEVRPGWLGIEVASAGVTGAGSTAEVQEVLPDAPAARAGVQKGDRLLQVGSKKIENPEDVLDASFFLTVNDEVAVKLARKGDELELKVQPAEHPAAEHPDASDFIFTSPLFGPRDFRAPAAVKIDR